VGTREEYQEETGKKGAHIVRGEKEERRKRLRYQRNA